MMITANIDQRPDKALLGLMLQWGAGRGVRASNHFPRLLAKEGELVPYMG